ncbi:MAG: 30S ribosomal protein S12 methylthiotransferase RimO [Desulfobulbus propionicus]|nr:MAG: 30S ribosomal protein S12 methylthiotransferase RimO [Desulfobulbus propionicus]
MKTVYIVSLGCPKNLVDTEVMFALLEQNGYSLSDLPAQADVLLVNTCGFIRPAVEEAIDELLRLAENKHEKAILIATGCMVQRYGRELAAALPEVDIFLGLDQELMIIEAIETLKKKGAYSTEVTASTYIMNVNVPRKLSTPFYRSFLKITEGCDNHCTYCMIPAIRGNLRSRNINDLVAEAVILRGQGVQEVTLIAQDLCAYGDDFACSRYLVPLLQALLDRTTIPWIRLLYLYPSSLPEELLQLMAEQNRIVPYLDIPIQHTVDSVLKAMNRRYGYRQLDRLINRIRTYLPDCALRTTIMVGFPGETDDDVARLLMALEKWQFDHVGVFCYEDEEGTRAAQLSGKVLDDVKKIRYKKVMETQAGISLNRQQRYVGRIEPVLVEGVSRESDLLLEGRTRYQAPDIDGCVYINDGQAETGDIVQVLISEAHPYDLVGKVVDAP